MATAFAFLNIAVSETDFENGVVYARNAIAWKFTCLQLFAERDGVGLE